MSRQEIYNVSEELEGVRLDKALVEVLPGSGLRLRRRLCDEGKVLINGKVRKPGYKVRTGQELIIRSGVVTMTHEELGLKIIHRNDQFAAVYKPGAVHSARIEGKGSANVEDVLPSLFPDSAPVLLNRLDYLTSGILLVALNSDGVNKYRELEDAGDIKKFYKARVKGRFDGFVSVQSKLDCDDRKTTKVLEESDVDTRRWTEVEAIAHDRDLDTTDVRCLIVKGARHQIRAHLASIGHPIVGDPMYGDAAGDLLHLHHQRIEFPGFEAEQDGPF
ncbi:RluA family pseudouridine synthase [Pseudodesulfovibrio sp. zrk46]|uniref:pseudouridine synthase n=1 Tax=Pseudodesulfovibrio sp. zrk46 TaxID=2725288 RepID=UPI001449128F|nr:RluA family pseudouridine synthase [Pseudodesulfovibrio sp. zrk46]QJB57915.1 RluA family pseudouridine synthase [Pseudodesulfovibrio sp. zrk46]